MTNLLGPVTVIEQFLWYTLICFSPN